MKVWFLLLKGMVWLNNLGLMLVLIVVIKVKE